MYLRTRVIDACEALDVMLGFHQYQMSRSNQQEEVREVTDQLVGDGDDGLLPPQNKPLEQYTTASSPTPKPELSSGYRMVSSSLVLSYWQHL